MNKDKTKGGGDKKIIRVAETWSRKKLDKVPFKELGDWVTVFNWHTPEEFVYHYANIKGYKFNFLFRLWAKINSYEHTQG